MPQTFSEGLIAIGLGACFVFGVAVASTVWRAFNAAFACEQRFNCLEKMFKDAMKNNWEFEKTVNEIKKQYPIKEKK